MGSVANLWRHPIKGVGREELKSVKLENGRCMPMDRIWAVAHENSKVNFQNPEWASCLNFVRAASNYGKPYGARLFGFCMIKSRQPKNWMQRLHLVQG